MTHFTKWPAAIEKLLMNLPSCLCLWGCLLTALSSCHSTRPDAAAVPTVGFVSQETISHACSQRTVRRSGTSGFESLPDGKESYMARLAMVEAAQKTLDVQYFIWSDDVSGTVFADRLLAAADRGVRVRLLLDMAVGAQKEVRSAALAAHPNIQVGFFNPMTALKGVFAGNPIPLIGEIDRMQCRMHNKIMIADNTILIGGGRNLGDAYFGIHRKNNSRDLDYIANGPVVKDAAKAYDLYWKSPLTVIDDQTKVTGRDRKKLEDLRERVAKKKRKLAEDNRCPYPIALHRGEALRFLSQMTGRMIWTDYKFVADPPERMLKTTREASPVGHSMEDALAAAKKDIVIHNAYFIPQHGLLNVLQEAVQRGVRVRILTNSLSSKSGLAAMAGYANRRLDILNTGAELYELKGKSPSRRGYVHADHLTTLSMHTKGLVVDDHLSFITSYNMDPRSKFINTESGVFVEDARFAARLKDYLLVDLQPTHCWRVWRDRKGEILWYGQRPDGEPRVHQVEPGVPLSYRLKYWLYRLVAWEDVL